MSTANPFQPGPNPSEAAAVPVNTPSGANNQSAAVDDSGSNSDQSTSEEVDPQLVMETKQQIRALVQEIAQLSQSDCELTDFYDGFLTRVVSALASVGGAIWTRGERGTLELRYQINLSKTGLTENKEYLNRHGLLLKKMLASAQPMLVPPQSGSPDDEEAGNPTDFLLVMSPIKDDHDVHGIVEIFQRPGNGPSTNRGYLRFLAQMCELASDYFKNRRLRHYSDRQSLWEHLEQFIHTIHRGLDPQETVFTIANEGRRLIGCDRVSVAVCRGGRCTIEAVSGLDTIDRRSEEVKRLKKLAKAVISADAPLWYIGDCDDLAPQIENALHDYIDHSHAKLLVVLPLHRPVEEETSGKRKRREAIGALVIEQLRDGRLTEGLPKRVEVVADHSADALNNSLEHHRLFLLPLWKTLGKATELFRGRTLPKTVLAIAAALTLLTFLCMAPADFDLAARGSLRPEVRRDIFTQMTGVVVDVPVKHLQSVEKGQTLAQLRNTDLEFEITTIIGRQTTTREQITSLQRALLNNPRMSPEEQNRLSGELLQLEETAVSLRRQIALYREKEKQLEIKSPLRGQVVTWQVREILQHRPIERGQILMTVIDPQGPWELELRMPERRMGHIVRQARQSKEPMRVTFVLATHPGKEFEGTIVEIDQTADVRDDEGNTVLIRVATDKSALPDLRDGAQVTAKVHCGRRAVGYVWFHDLIETIQANVLFWL